MPCSYQLRESGCWTVDLEIRRRGRRLLFSLNENLPTEEQARVRCSGLGRRIIDGGLPGWSVDRLRRGRRDSPSLIHRCMAGLLRPLVLAGLLMLGFGAFLWLREPRVTIRSDALTLGAATAAAHEQQSVQRRAAAAALVTGVTLLAVVGRKRA